MPQPPPQLTHTSIPVGPGHDWVLRNLWGCPLASRREAFAGCQRLEGCAESSHRTLEGTVPTPTLSSLNSFQKGPSGGGDGVYYPRGGRGWCSA